MLNITKGRIDRAQKTVIYGPEGIGKTSLAARHPDPVIIDTEGGTAHMDVRRIGKPESWEELLSIIKEVAATPGICKTLAIDTADWAEQLATTYVCNKYKQNSIESFGYGKGYTYLAEEFARFLSACDLCIAAGINVVITAHDFPEANILGVTATPDRGDMKNLGEFFDSKAYEYSMMDAIREGYLTPIKAQMIPLELNISDVGMSSGDFAAGEIGCALEPYLEQIAAEMTNYCKDRKTVVFLPLIATSQKFCRMLNDAGLRAAEVNGNSDDRSGVLADFEAGKYDVLCNSMLLTEGWDCPAVDCIVVLRPTKIRSLYQQMVGRGMSLYPGKTELLLLDFL